MSGENGKMRSLGLIFPFLFYEENKSCILLSSYKIDYIL